MTAKHGSKPRPCQISEATKTAWKAGTWLAGQGRLAESLTKSHVSWQCQTTHDDTKPLRTMLGLGSRQKDQVSRSMTMSGLVGATGIWPGAKSKQVHARALGSGSQQKMTGEGSGLAACQSKSPFPWLHGSAFTQVTANLVPSKKVASKGSDLVASLVFQLSSLCRCAPCWG